MAEKKLSVVGVVKKSVSPFEARPMFFSSPAHAGNTDTAYAPQARLVGLLLAASARPPTFCFFSFLALD